MATISSSDIVMATVVQRGRELASFKSSGFSSIAELIRAVVCSVGGAFGMMEINLRNTSRGWSERRPLFVKAPPAGIQLSLF